jgi:hypothetical protein
MKIANTTVASDHETDQRAALFARFLNAKLLIVVTGEG